MTTHMAIDLETAAQEAAGNWRKFESFSWHDQPDDADDWYIGYTSNRDSGLLEQSNGAAIKEELQPLTEGDDPDVRFERHSHWAVGHVDGFLLRVYKNGAITEAFKKLVELKDRLANYPILNEEDHSKREWEATHKNIEEAAKAYVRHLYDSPSLPDDFVAQLYQWFSDQLPAAIENRDDQGGHPNDKQLEKAFLALDWLMECEVCRPSTHHGHCHYCDKRFDDDGETNPLTGHEFCSVTCFDDGYDGRRKGVEP